MQKTDSYWYVFLTFRSLSRNMIVGYCTIFPSRGVLAENIRWAIYWKNTVRKMIEAVNSSLQNAALLRASAEQSSNADVFSANPAPAQKIARAPSLSVYVDVNYNTAVLQYRNAETRDVIDQIPSETLLQNRARDEARRAAAQQEAVQPRTERTPAPTQQAVQQASVPAPQTPTQQTQTADAPAPRTSAPTPQQIAAFTSAASAGNTNAGFTAAVTVFA